MTQCQCYICYCGLYNKVWRIVNALQGNQLNITGPIIQKLARLVHGSHWGNAFRIFNTPTFPVLTTPGVLKFVTSLSSSVSCLRSTSHSPLNIFRKKFESIFRPRISSILMNSPLFESFCISTILNSRMYTVQPKLYACSLHSVRENVDYARTNPLDLSRCLYSRIYL